MAELPSTAGSPNPGALATATKLQLGTQFVDTDIPQATDNHERLRSNGLYHATVTHTLGREPEYDQVDIDFTIDPGKRAKFGGIALEGNPLRSPAAVIRSTRWRGFWGLGRWSRLPSSACKRASMVSDRITRSMITCSPASR